MEVKCISFMAGGVSTFCFRADAGRATEVAAGFWERVARV